MSRRHIDQFLTIAFSCSLVNGIDGDLLEFLLGFIGQFIHCYAGIRNVLSIVGVLLSDDLSLVAIAASWIRV